MINLATTFEIEVAVFAASQEPAWVLGCLADVFGSRTHSALLRNSDFPTSVTGFRVGEDMASKDRLLCVEKVEVSKCSRAPCTQDDGLERYELTIGITVVMRLCPVMMSS